MVQEPDKTLAIVSSEGSSYKRITIEELNNLGYELAGREMPMGKLRDARYRILEMKNEDNKNTISWCYLYSMDEQAGVILPNTYNFYLMRYRP